MGVHYSATFGFLHGFQGAELRSSLNLHGKGFLCIVLKYRKNMEDMFVTPRKMREG